MRKFISYITLILLLSNLAPAQNVIMDMTMWTTGTVTLWDGNTTKFYGFSPGFTQPWFPGPTVYCNEGDSVIIRVRNQSQGPQHTIHLHGLDVDQANDGVPGLSFVIEHMDTGIYRFKATHAGTYIYHCHVASVVHVQMGMYGSVVVRAAGGSNNAYTGGPAFHREYEWLMSEFDKSWHDTIPVHHTGDSVHAVFPIPAYVPDYFFVNGRSRQQLADSSTAIYGQGGEKLYMRLINVGFLMNEVIFPAAMNATIISSDGRPLPNQIQSDTIVLTPGERYGVMLNPMTEFSDSTQINYINMNTQQITASEFVPIDISGFIGRDELVESETWQIFPNPVAQTLFVRATNPTTKRTAISFYNLLGQEIHTTSLMAGASQYAIDVSMLDAGMYVVKVVQTTKAPVQRTIRVGR